MRWSVPAGGRHDGAVDDIKFPNPDAAYRAIVEAHRGLSDDQSAALDTALVLILANHIGDAVVLADAIALAKRRLPGARTENETR